MGESAAKPRELRLRIPAELDRDLGADEEASAALLESYVVDRFRQNKMSSGYCAQVLGISRRDFFEVLARHNVPYFEADEIADRADRRAIERYEKEHGG